MRDNSIGFLPVCDGAGKLIGALTDRDLAVRVCAEGRSPDTPVRDAMTTPAISCSEDEPVTRAESLMREHQIIRLPVLGPGDNLVGVISLVDVVAKVRGGEALRIARALLGRDGGRPARAHGEHPPHAVRASAGRARGRAALPG